MAGRPFEIETLPQALPNLGEAGATVQRDGDDEQLRAEIVPDGIGPTGSQLRGHVRVAFRRLWYRRSSSRWTGLPRLSSERSMARPCRCPMRGRQMPASVWRRAVKSKSRWPPCGPRQYCSIASAPTTTVSISGGDSLSARQVVSHLWEQYDIELSPQALFEQGMIAALLEELPADVVQREEGA